MVTGLLLLITITACSSSASVSDKREQLESIIRQGLPDQVRDRIGVAALVQNVSCTHEDGNSFECIADVSASDGSSTTLGIKGTCDNETCTWRTE